MPAIDRTQFSNHDHEAESALDTALGRTLVKPTIADAVLAHARLDVVLDVIKGRKDALREFLAARAVAVEETTGAAFTARVTGVGTATLTDPQPRVKVVDHDEFCADVDASGITRPDGSPLVATRDVWRVRDDASLGDLWDRADRVITGDETDEGVGLADAVHNALVLDVEYRLAEEAVEFLVGSGFIRATDAGAFWTVVPNDADSGPEPGDEVAGTETARAPRVLNVRVDKSFREADRDALEGALDPIVEDEA